MKPVIYLDASKPSSMFLTGTRVDEWVDANGSGRSVKTSVNGTSYNPTFDSTLFGGKGGVHFTGTNKYLESAAAFTSLSWARGFTTLCAGTYRSLFFGASDSTALILGAGLGSRLGVGTMGQSSHGLPNAPCIFGLRWDKSKVDFILNGVIYPVWDGSPIYGSGNFGILQIGGLEPGGSMDFDMAGFQAFDAILDEDSVATQCAAMQLKYGFADLPTPKYNVVVDGNSLAVGQISNGVTTMWDGMKAISGTTPMDMINVADNGISTVSLSARAATVVDPLLNLSVPSKRRVLIVWEITNDLSGTTQTDTAAYANIKTYCQARKAAGWKVIVCTCLPRTQSGINTNFELYRNSVNASIVANAISEGWADAVADIGGDATIGATGASNNTTYYATDKIHLNAAGHTIGKTYITNALNAVMV